MKLTQPSEPAGIWNKRYLRLGLPANKTVGVAAMQLTWTDVQGPAMVVLAISTAAAIVTAPEIGCTPVGLTSKSSTQTLMRVTPATGLESVNVRSPVIASSHEAELAGTVYEAPVSPNVI